jgi:hypothetical protein
MSVTITRHTDNTSFIVESRDFGRKIIFVGIDRAVTLHITPPGIQFILRILLDTEGLTLRFASADNKQITQNAFSLGFAMQDDKYVKIGYSQLSKKLTDFMQVTSIREYTRRKPSSYVKLTITQMQHLDTYAEIQYRGDHEPLYGTYHTKGCMVALVYPDTLSLYEFLLSWTDDNEDVLCRLEFIDKLGSVLLFHKTTGLSYMHDDGHVVSKCSIIFCMFNILINICGF